MKRSEARSKESINFAKTQRRTANEFAFTLWQWIRNRQILNQKFRREYPISPYTVDFCCPELMVVIEVDGADHFTEQGKVRDSTRDQYLASSGYQILRIPGYDVLRDGRLVIARVSEFVNQALLNRDSKENPSTPTPSPRDGAKGSDSTIEF